MGFFVLIKLTRAPPRSMSVTPNRLFGASSIWFIFYIKYYLQNITYLFIFQLQHKQLLETVFNILLA